MMKNNWFDERKDLFIKELVSEYFKAADFFIGLCDMYRKNGKVKFLEMDAWVGTELNKGPLWDLKDLSHSLFRDRPSRVGILELLFDWTLGSIFHECMKLKEDVYQLEAYWPRYQDIKKRIDLHDEIDKILQEYVVFIKKTELNMQKNMEKIEYLFSKSTDQITKFIIDYSQNGLLIIHLLDNKDIVDRVSCKNKITLERIFDSMYEKGFEEAYAFAGQTLLEGGWYERAIEFFESALKMDPNNTEIQEKINIAKENLKT